MSKCLWSGWNWQKGCKQISSLFTCCPVNHEYSWKKSQVEKKKQIMLYNMQEQILSVWWMNSVLNLSWRRSLLYRNQSIDLQNKSMDWFLYDRNFRLERVNALLLECIHWDIFLDYDKIVDIYASKYQKRMLLINPLSKNWTAETLNARKTNKTYIDFGIFSLHFIVVICKIFCFAWLLATFCVHYYKLQTSLVINFNHRVII